MLIPFNELSIKDPIHLIDDSGAECDHIVEMKGFLVQMHASLGFKTTDVEISALQNLSTLSRFRHTLDCWTTRM